MDQRSKKRSHPPNPRRQNHPNAQKQITVYSLFRPVLFNLEPEQSHQLTLQLLRLAGQLAPIRWLLQKSYNLPIKPVQAFGLNFNNPLGVAAGYDKDGLAMRGLFALGLGHVEVGTVTLRPQIGNPFPRVFRLLEDEAVINRMGFPSKGADFLMKQIKNYKRQPQNILGVNLGKNKDTQLEEAVNDYIQLMRAFAPLADYLTINISSPNTVGLRRLQGKTMLQDLLSAIKAERITSEIKCPILVKIAPDLNDEELNDALDAIVMNEMNGVIATNTTLNRDGLISSHQQEKGGLSGRPLRALSDSILIKVIKQLNGQLPVVAVGGIMTSDDAKKKIDLGASLVQVYSGLIYSGPNLIKEIVKKL